MAVQYFYHILSVRHILGYLVIDYLSLVIQVKYLFFHYTFAYGSHLWAMFRVDDGGYYVAAKGRPYLVELFCVVFLLHYSVSVLDIHIKIANLQLGTVSSQSAVESRGDTRTQVTSNNSGTHEAYLWFLFLEKVYHQGCMGVGSVGEESLGIKYMYLIHTIGHYLFLDTIQSFSSADTFKLYAKGIS